MQHLVLASGSPRRKELLSNLQLSFDIFVSNIDEIIDSNLKPEEMVMSLAYQKAKAVANQYPDSYVIGADTIVLFQNQILGKPKNEAESIEVLKKLSNNTHEVITGVAIIYQDKSTTFFEKTEVTFWDLSEDEITKYVATGEPKDKAGSYGIQELGSALVKHISGDYFSVVGLPVSRTLRELRKLGFKC
ncbi:Maf family protein [Ferdinandcohnia quinoae]|uniref:dTTP/UTP pyrophosphatase n=1 Tax=Fredinandcohnia quinoae TaxID=2918902 RepID=A0AAW5E0X3_9BACI|nr:Maf family protein [Fredinandcohnia sp. SECRCQ15]MCH1626565.1 Maf family protein [Fredinandcohnia sp. SECRCQ15]